MNFYNPAPTSNFFLLFIFSDDLDVSEISCEIRNEISEFMTKTSRKDSLNDIQLAWLKRFAAQHKDDTINAHLAQKAIAEGRKANIWPQDFAPNSKFCFETYLCQKLKNLRKKKTMPNITERLNQAITLKMTENPSGQSQPILPFITVAAKKQRLMLDIQDPEQENNPNSDEDDSGDDVGNINPKPFINDIVTS